MLTGLFPIITNTLTETLRQPIYGVVIASTILLMIFIPSLSMYTLDDDDVLMMDIGLSTLMLSGLFLSVFAAATVVTDEIENKTVLTVITKTVSRTTFVIGKFIGIAISVLLAQYLLTIVLLMVCRHGTLQTASHEVDSVTLTLGSIAGGLACLIGLTGNYFYRWRFTSSAIISGIIFMTLAGGALFFVDKQWKYNPADNHMHTELFGHLALICLATIILTAIAVAASLRFNMVMTLTICCLMFVIGAMSQDLLGGYTQSNGVASYLAWAVIGILPSINTFVATQSLYTDGSVPIDYITQTGIYTMFYTLAVLLISIAIFQKRQLS